MSSNDLVTRIAKAMFNDDEIWDSLPADKKPMVAEARRAVATLEAEIEGLREALGLTTMLLTEMRHTLDEGGLVGPVSIIDNILSKVAALKGHKGD